MLYRMSFSQLLTMIEVRNARERRAYEAAQAAAAEEGDGDPHGYVRPPPMKDLDNPDNLPNVSDIQRMFGGMMG